MDNDKTIEDLEKRKKELQLRHEIANLERSERIRDTSSKWSAALRWWWVGPLTLVALFWIFATSGNSVLMLLGIPFLVPISLKVVNYWRK